MEKDKDEFIKGKKFFQIFIGFIVLGFVSVMCFVVINNPGYARELDFIQACGWTGGLYVLYRIARFFDI